MKLEQYNSIGKFPARGLLVRKSEWITKNMQGQQNDSRRQSIRQNEKLSTINEYMILGCD